MCAEAKINSVSLVSPDLNQIEQLSSGVSSGIIQCYLGILVSFRLLSIKNGRGFHITLCDVTSTSFRFDLVMMQLLLQEMVMPFLTNYDLDENEIFIILCKTCHILNDLLSKH